MYAHTLIAPLRGHLVEFFMNVLKGRQTVHVDRETLLAPLSALLPPG